MDLGKRTTLENDSEAKHFVRARREFTASKRRMFGRCDYNGLYIVYSWGTHWPLYIYDDSVDQWYGCNEKHTRSTNRHANVCQPVPCEKIVWYNNSAMVAKFNAGTELHRITQKVTT